MERLKSYKITFHRPNKFQSPITESAIVRITDFKGFVADKLVSKNVIAALEPYEKAVLDMNATKEERDNAMDTYAAIAAFYQSFSSNLIVDSVTAL